jgi:hypothetical protein
MSSAPTANVIPKPPESSILAAILSYLVPGLGQIYQGRFGKGILFMVSLLGMFILGQWMGNWQNVYYNPTNETDRQQQNRIMRIFSAVVGDRWQYAGQFWIGIAAWPALWQHMGGPLPNKENHRFWHDFQKAPSTKQEEDAINKFFVESDKTPDLGWVYTVVAGMLNILVIYDAYAGPVFLPIARPSSKETAVPEQKQAKKEGVA